MKVSVCAKKCIGCGACVSIANDIFDLDLQKGVAVVVKQSKEKNQAAIDAAESCPTSAIIISNKEKSNEQNKRE